MSPLDLSAAGGVHGEAITVAPSSTACTAVGTSSANCSGSYGTRTRKSDMPICPGPLPNAVSTCSGVRSAIQPGTLMPPKPRISWNATVRSTLMLPGEPGFGPGLQALLSSEPALALASPFAYSVKASNQGSAEQPRAATA